MTHVIITFPEVEQVLPDPREPEVSLYDFGCGHSASWECGICDAYMPAKQVQYSQEGRKYYLDLPKPVPFPHEEECLEYEKYKEEVDSGTQEASS